MMEDAQAAGVAKRRSTVLLVLLGVGWALALVAAAPSVAAGRFAGVTITYALVIGNSKYINLEPLLNPGNDAVALAAALRKRGIPVSLKLDADLRDLKAEIAEFRKQIKPGSTSLFFFSGHGWNLQNRNYIFGVDAPKGEDLLAGKNLDQVLLVADVYEGVAGRMLVLLDTHGNPSDVPSNVVLAYSGSTSHEALDNYRLPDGKMSQNSPYTASLIETLDGNHKNLPTAFLDLSQRVVDKTNGAQIPWVSRSINAAASWTP
jgi:Caspase domain